MRHEISSLIRQNLEFHKLNKRAQGSIGLSLVQFHLLMTLRDMPACSPQGLAREVGMHPSTLTPGLRRLQKKGWIFVAEDPKDSRKKMLTLTLQGNALLQKANVDIQRLVEQSRNGFLRHSPPLQKELKTGARHL